MDGFFLRAESMYNAASYIDELDDDPEGGAPIRLSYGGKSLHNQSHGESFLSVVENRFGGKGIYILDEPEAALSPARLLRLMCNIKELVDNDSQFIIATHSPFLLSMGGAKIYDMDEEPVDVKRWTELDNVRAYYDFFKKHEHEFE